MSEPVAGRARALLNSPKGLAVLAELAGKSVRNLDEYSTTTRGIGASWIPAHGPGTDIRALLGNPPDTEPPLETTQDRNLDDPQDLLVTAAQAVSGWAWNPLARSATTNLLADANRYADLARHLASSTGAGWWWNSFDAQKQVSLTSEELSPQFAATEEAARTCLTGNPRTLPYGELVLTSTATGPEIPAALLCDVEITSRLTSPISCWEVQVDAGTNVFEIHSPLDWLRLCYRYPRAYDVPDHWSEWGVRTNRAFGVDWSSMTADWDAMHISMAGVLTATDLPIIIGNSTTILEGFSTELTVWFSNPPHSPKYLGVAESPLS